MSALRDLTGEVFGRLTVIKRAPNITTNAKPTVAWECLCSCGTTKILSGGTLKGGMSTSCGCLIGQYGTKLKPGMRFTWLETISFSKGKWLCKCDCGKTINLKTKELVTGNNQSCGCYNAECRRQYEPRIASALNVYRGYAQNDPECLPFKDFLRISQENCTYCGLEPSSKQNKFLLRADEEQKANPSKSIIEGDFVYNGIDRIDNAKGHTLENCCAYDYTCNRIKSSRSIKELLEWTSKLKTTTFEQLVILSLSLPNNTALVRSIKTIFKHNYQRYSDLTIEEFYFLSQQPCFYCGEAAGNLYNASKKHRGSSQSAVDNGWFHYNGLDRINLNGTNKKGHFRDQIVPCCKWCNWSKSNMSLSDFYSWITRFQAFQQSKRSTSSNSPQEAPSLSLQILPNINPASALPIAPDTIESPAEASELTSIVLAEAQENAEQTRIRIGIEAAYVMDQEAWDYLPMEGK